MRDDAACSGDGELQQDSQNHFPVVFKQYSQQTWLSLVLTVSGVDRFTTQHVKDMETGRVLTETGGACSSAHRSKVLVIGQCLLYMLYYVTCTCQDKFPYVKKPIIDQNSIFQCGNSMILAIALSCSRFIYPFYISLTFCFHSYMVSFYKESLDTKVPNMVS